MIRRPTEKLGVLRLSDGVLAHVLTAAPEAFARKLQWTADGITYVDVVQGVANIWGQSLNGDPPRQLTRFTSGRIVQYDWSANGKELAYARRSINNDVVLVRLRQ